MLEDVFLRQRRFRAPQWLPLRFCKVQQAAASNPDIDVRPDRIKWLTRQRAYADGLLVLSHQVGDVAGGLRRLWLQTRQS